jgi:hypothetical protein
MIVEQSAIVILGGLLSVLVAPYAYYQPSCCLDRHDIPYRT